MFGYPVLVGKNFLQRRVYTRKRTGFVAVVFKRNDDGWENFLEGFALRDLRDDLTECLERRLQAFTQR